jgi:FAD/FMN-containing dehydrogenase
MWHGPGHASAAWARDATLSLRDVAAVVPHRGGLVELRGFGDQLVGDIVLPGDASWDTARQAWNLAVDQRPVAVVYPETADDVVAVVRFAAEHRLRIAFNAGGHNAGPIDWDRDTLLLKSERMRGIRIDPERRRARVEAGVLSKPLAVAAGEHGLAYLAGTSADVGVLGYALGGGMSWMVRAHGLACNTIVAAEVVTADGRLVRVDRESEPELFWALRGGSGNVAAVTALELELFPVAEIYAGAMLWPIERAREILAAWRGWIETVPETCESLGRMLQLPDAPFLPAEVRGRSFVLIEVAIIGSVADGVALVQPLRDLGPEIDGVAMMPPSELSLVNMDPELPLPYSGEGILLDDLPAAAIDAMVETFVGSSLLHVEVRHLGGAAATRSADHGVLDAIDQPFIAFTFGLAPDPDTLTVVDGHVRRLLKGLGPWDSGRRYLNFAESAMDPRSIVPAETYDRFEQVKARYDPTGMFRANHAL